MYNYKNICDIYDSSQLCVSYCSNFFWWTSNQKTAIVQKTGGVQGRGRDAPWPTAPLPFSMAIETEDTHGPNFAVFFI